MGGEPTHRVVLVRPEGSEQTITVGEREHIWDAAKLQGITLPAICHQGRCLTCAGLLEGVGAFDASDATHYYPVDRKAGYILLCTAKPRSNLRILTDQQHEMRAFRSARKLPAPYS